MLRIIIQRKMLDRYSGLATDELETLDIDCPELERVLTGGGFSEGHYDYRKAIGVEVLPQQQKGQL